MIIEKSVINKLQIADYAVKHHFFSRRNAVFLVEAFREDGLQFDFVYKSYIAGDMQTEYENLIRMNSSWVPKVLALGRTALCLEYIEGPLMIEKLESAEKTNSSFTGEIAAFVTFLDIFYTAMPGYIYGDINFRNFIFGTKGVSGIDLEEAAPGEIAVDIGNAASYLLTYDPCFTPYKNEVTDYFIQLCVRKFDLNIKEVENEKKRGIESINTRRALKNKKLFSDVNVSSGAAN
ncbi:MAG: hypothetical protein RBT69_01510 [Spirochaetia bacterium]|jgi:tRNA A-37 threonylcarbamoyl transferase component Bud32|nr:hypothetical protein [Spirochaetia bacterium]